jgi:hypothetical protein
MHIHINVKSPNNISKWQMGFNSAFKGLIHPLILTKHLTGLDPAGPAFTYESCEVRLCKGDAIFTEAIHTNGRPLIGFGTSDESGRNMPF